MAVPGFPRSAPVRPSASVDAWTPACGTGSRWPSPRSPWSSASGPWPSAGSTLAFASTIDGQNRVVISELDPGSPAWSNGLRPGMVVLRLAGVTLINLPAYIYPTTEPSPDPVTGETPAATPIGVEPASPTAVPIDPADRAALMAQPVTDLDAIQPWDLERGSPDSYPIASFSDYTPNAIRETMPAVIFGIGLLLIVGWWLASGRAGENLRPLAAPLAVATSVPFITQPLAATLWPPLIALGGLLVTLAMLPLALGLIERIADRGERRLVGYVTAACALAAAAVVLAVATFDSWFSAGDARWLLVGAIPIIPGLAAAGPIQAGGIRGVGSSSGRLLESTEFAVAGVTPLMALLTDTSPFVFPLWLWFAIVLAAGRFTIRPLARLAPGQPCSAISSSPRPRPSGRGSRPTSTTTRSRS